MKSKWITHRGIRIFYSGYSGFGNDFAGFKAEVDYATEEVMKEPENSVLSLVDVRDTMGQPEMVDYLKKIGNVSKGHIKKTAVIGVTGYRLIFLKAVARVTSMSLVPFDDDDKAKDWLIKGETPDL